MDLFLDIPCRPLANLQSDLNEAFLIKNARNWEKATYSDDIAAKLGLTTSPEETTENPEEQPPPQN